VVITKRYHGKPYHRPIFGAQKPKVLACNDKAARIFLGRPQKKAQNYGCHHKDSQ
jgi:hypothetical protein